MENRTSITVSGNTKKVLDEFKFEMVGKLKKDVTFEEIFLYLIERYRATGEPQVWHTTNVPVRKGSATVGRAYDGLILEFRAKKEDVKKEEASEETP